MSGEAIIYDADLSPTKPEIAQRFGAITNMIGSYRFVDPDGEVGIEMIVGTDLDERLMQLALVYSPEPLEGSALLTEMEHSILGKRYVGPVTASPVAVREFIRVILTGDDGATYSDGSGPQIEVRGSGASDVSEDVVVGEVVIREFTRQRATGTVLIDDHTRAFFLRIPNLLVPGRENATGHTTSRMRLTGWKPEDPTDTRILAELSWGDLEK